MMTYYLATMSVRVEIPLAHPVLLRLRLSYSVGNGGRNISLQENNKSNKTNKKEHNTMFVVFPAGLIQKILEDS